jgi:hypothetical protein
MRRRSAANIAGSGAADRLGPFPARPLGKFKTTIALSCGIREGCAVPPHT